MGPDGLPGHGDRAAGFPSVFLPFEVHIPLYVLEAHLEKSVLWFLARAQCVAEIDLKIDVGPLVIDQYR